MLLFTDISYELQLFQYMLCVDNILKIFPVPSRNYLLKLMLTVLFVVQTKISLIPYRIEARRRLIKLQKSCPTKINQKTNSLHAFRAKPVYIIYFRYSPYFYIIDYTQFKLEIVYNCKHKWYTYAIIHNKYDLTTMEMNTTNCLI